jgi:hypothetical protein
MNCCKCDGTSRAGEIRLADDRLEENLLPRR